ncbi:MAG: DUF3467 domain-containing protein [Acidobacteriota bacterium]|nr:DUF3467 domain-containing protein [Acidobacteriota bacterium]
MAEQEQSEKVVTPTDDEDYFTGYANGVGIAHTFFDFQFHFSEVKVRDVEHIEAQAFATIMMSPQHAKLLLGHLKQNMDLYESKFGEIKVPDHLISGQTVDIPIRTKAE